MAKQKRIKPTRVGTDNVRSAAERVLQGRRREGDVTVSPSQWDSYMSVQPNYRGTQVTMPLGKRARSNKAKVEQAMTNLATAGALDYAGVAAVFTYEFGNRTGPVISPMLDVLANKTAARWHHNTAGVDAQIAKLAEIRPGVTGEADDIARGCYGMKSELQARTAASAYGTSFTDAARKHMDAMLAATDSGDIRRVVDTAYTVCLELGLIDEPEEQQPNEPDDSTSDGGSEGGDGEGQGNEPQDQQDQQDQQGDQQDPQGGNAEGEDTSKPVDQRLTNVHQAADKAEEVKPRDPAPRRPQTNKQHRMTNTAGMQYGHEYVEIPNVLCVEDTIHANLKGILEHFMTQTYKLDDDFSGTASDYAGEMNFGNFDVFHADRREAGRIVIGVDCSGSMGGGVTYKQGMNAHQSKFDQPNNSFLAWQCAMALSKAFPEAVVFGYEGTDGHQHWGDGLTSGSGHARIGQVLPGQRPATCADGLDPYVLAGRLGGARMFEVSGGQTPECTAMLYMKELLSGKLDGASGVIITDGIPNDVMHTAQVAKSMTQSGFSFGVVRVGEWMDKSQIRDHAADYDSKRGPHFSRYAANMQYLVDHDFKLYPQQASIDIRSIGDLPKLARIMEYLRERG